MPQGEASPGGLRQLRRKLFLLGLAWAAVALVGALLFENTPMMIVVTALLFFGWLALLFFSIKYLIHVFSGRR